MAERRRLEKYAQRRGAPSIAEALARFTPGAAACGAEVGAAPRRERTALAKNARAFAERAASPLRRRARMKKRRGKISRRRAFCEASLNICCR